MKLSLIAGWCSGLLLHPSQDPENDSKQRNVFSYLYVAFGVSTGRRIISISAMAIADAIANVMKAIL